MNQTADAFELSEYVARTSGLIREFNKDGTPEGVTRMENVEELLNGIKDFVENQKEIADTTGSLAEFLEEAALDTDLDADKGDPNHVTLMTIHLAKGLEFPYVFIVGLEEDLFPSAMSMNTRSELEEERRLFYVALTRAEKQAYLTYALSRYRWGKLIDSEPSRFIEEIEDQYLDIITPTEERRFNPMLSADIFGDVEPNKIRYKPAKKPIFKKGKPAKKEPEKFQVTTPKNLKPVSKTNGSTSNNSNLFDSKLAVANIVKHIRFGTGEVMKIEGTGADIKAEINFQHGGVKKLLLRFAKLEVVG
jgi:DNA helicase-2/ATP-dependent DNA helicase PcrA